MNLSRFHLYFSQDPMTNALTTPSNQPSPPQGSVLTSSTLSPSGTSSSSSSITTSTLGAPRPTASFPSIKDYSQPRQPQTERLIEPDLIMTTSSTTQLSSSNNSNPDNHGGTRLTPPPTTTETGLSPAAARAAANAVDDDAPICRICHCDEQELLSSILVTQPNSTPNTPTDKSGVDKEFSPKKFGPPGSTMPITPGHPSLKLISPCKCLGSLRWVHHYCLQQWIRSSNNTRCELCKCNFSMSIKYKPIYKVCIIIESMNRSGH